MFDRYNGTAGVKTKRGKVKQIVLRTCYTCKWAHYKADQEICYVNPEPLYCFKRDFWPCRFHKLDQGAKEFEEELRRK